MFSCKIVRNEIETRAKFVALKTFVFDQRVSFKVSAKSGTNFGLFARTVVNEMKPMGILCSKMLYFQSYSHPPMTLNKNVQKHIGSGQY
jgi:hypothetical protein